MKKTKIICTLGPASNNRETLKALMENGMDIARFNFSHGDHEEQKGRVDMVKELREELDMPIAMLLDTKGPEIRTRLLKDGQKVKLEAGKQFVLGIGDFEGDSTKVAITYETLYKDVKPGNKILIDDGLIELEVKAIKGTDIVCDILNGGELGEKKGVNVPYVKVNLPNLLVAGEAAGGIHGRNRLMGNSLLDVIVFGRNAGKKAAVKCKDVELGEMNLNHIYAYDEELKKADIHTDKVSPLLLPKYARHEQR